MLVVTPDAFSFHPGHTGRSSLGPAMLYFLRRESLPPCHGVGLQMKHSLEELSERALDRSEDFYLVYYPPINRASRCKPKPWEAGHAHPDRGTTARGYGDTPEAAIDDMIQNQEPEA